MRFSPNSGITELEPDVEYAAISAEPPYLVRPVKLTLGPLGMPMVIDPMAEPDVVRISSGSPEDFLVVGLWTDPVASYTHQGSSSMTWQQYAAHQLGQVLRQRDLAQRLTDFGIERTPEFYLPHTNTGNAVQRSLTLNYDELDQLLRAAGF